jgi:predicted metalloprotease with PDZ domain
VTNGAKSLDDVMKLAFARFSGARGFTPEEFRKTASEAAGVDLSAWFRTALETTDEIDFRPALEWYGLTFVASKWKDEDAAQARLGATTADTNGRLMVTNVPRGTPAFEAGVNAGDEIVAIDNFRVTPDQYAARLEALIPGTPVALLVARRDTLKTLTVKIVEAAPPMWDLQANSAATSAQQAHLAAWRK